MPWTSAAFLVALGPGDINEYPPHQARRHRHEMGAILPAHLPQVRQPQVGFVDERRWLKRLACSFPVHIAPREAPQFVVDERNEFLKGGLISVAPGPQQPSRPVRCP